MNTNKLYKSKTNIILTGVLGGCSDYLKMDATILRLLFVLVTLLTAFIPFLIFYIVAAFLIPHEGQRPVDFTEQDKKQKD
ncbi:PspC domain-containing protein [Pradoshia sp.]